MCEYPVLVLLIRKKESELSLGEQKAIQERFPGLPIRFESGNPETTGDFNSLCARLKPDAVLFFLTGKSDGYSEPLLLKSSDFDLLKSAEAPPRYLVITDFDGKGTTGIHGNEMFRNKKV